MSTNPLQTLVGTRQLIVTQGFGPTDWARGGGRELYRYATQFCMGEGQHPGYDIGGSIGWDIFAPVNGKVITAGGTGVFTDSRFGKRAGTGELKLVLDNGDHLILGHMESISVRVGDYVLRGKKVGTMGTNNGAHCHVEYRTPSRRCTSGWAIIDPLPALQSLAGPGTPAPTPPTWTDPTTAPPTWTEEPITETDWLGLAKRLERSMQLVPLEGDVLGGIAHNTSAVIARGVLVWVGWMMVRSAIK